MGDITVESELGVISGVENDTADSDRYNQYTKPEEVIDFVSQTKCDSLAVAVGTRHGPYKFSRAKGIQFDILKKIQEKLPEFPLVLHGGSAINVEEIQRINSAGGELGIDAKGVSNKQLLKAISLGVCKVSIATDSRLIWTRVHREFFSLSPARFDPVIPGKTFMEAFEEFNLEKFALLKATGKASKLKNKIKR